MPVNTFCHFDTWSENTAHSGIIHQRCVADKRPVIGFVNDEAGTPCAIVLGIAGKPILAPVRLAIFTQDNLAP